MRLLHLYRTFNSKWKFNSFGDFSVSMLLIAVLSGIFLVPAYNINNPESSLSLILLSNYPALFIRNLHYWSSQFFLVFLILHVWDHFVRDTERKLKFGVWIRLSFGILFIFFVMLSGFIIKGDADSLQAQRILNYLITAIPFVGEYISNIFIGKSGDFQLLYVHHIATATIFIFVILYEHSKIIWGKIKVFLYSLIFITAISLIATPLPKTEIDRIIRGPWYFLGLQELLHYLSSPGIVIYFILLLLLLLLYAPKLKSRFNELNKSVLLFFTLVYILITIFAFFFRGANWEFNPNLNDYKNSFSVNVINPFGSVDDSSYIFTKVGNRFEGCVSCHNDIKGFSNSHSPQALGCYSCHGGNPFSLDKEIAHSGMNLIPGNLSNAENACGTANCHPSIHQRVENSLMNKLTGMIAVNRFVFDEIDSPDDSATVGDLKDSPADKHLRQLCVACHIGAEKTEVGNITETSRGGGCLACHLNYSSQSLAELNDSTIKQKKFHPSVDLNITDEHCFGCHSRSGRISLNYTGYHETQLEPAVVDDTAKYKVLKDERVVEKVIPDVHHEKGMSCIDCHIAKEVMGDGVKYIHKEEQLKVKCEDCHSPLTKTVSGTNLTEEEKKIFYLRGMNDYGDTLLTASSGDALINSFSKEGERFLITKLGKEKLPLKNSSGKCGVNSIHKNVECSTCHSAWVPQCIGCHTEFDPNESGFDHLTQSKMEGLWSEYVGEFIPEPPVMGVRESDNGISIIPTSPGMILTIDKKNGNNEIYKRLYAPVSPHTTTNNVRDCKSCHLNSLALGYGRGELKFRIEKRTAKLSFIPEYSLRKEDGLPEDAWIKPLSNNLTSLSTRSNVRPLNKAEQIKILTVGLCLECHINEKETQEKFRLWKNENKISPECITSFSL